MKIKNSEISIVLPAKNEEEALKKLLPILIQLYGDAEIIIVNDGSTDDTLKLCENFNIKVINHPYSMGNGASVKSGVRESTREYIVFMDADGQHDPAEISSLVEKMGEGFDMVVGARSASSQASLGRLCANSFYNWFASFMVGQKVDDLTSGFRIARAAYMKEILYLLPNGFSYPTTATMAFFRSGYRVGYLPVNVTRRVGQSHIRPIRDGIRFLLILFKIGTLYSPLKIFFPISSIIFFTGLSYYLYTYITISRFTNMSALLLTTSVIIFLMGLLSEQITMLLYQRMHNKE